MVEAGVPNLLTVLLQAQLPFISQEEIAGVAAAFGSVGVPAGLVVLVVHDQVAVSLHAQTGCI